MDSNITLQSNIYINKTGNSRDEDFLRHVTDFKLLRENFRNPNSASGFYPWMTFTQKEIIQKGQPYCAKERGTMSWGLPVGGSRIRLRCEQFDCSHFESCSKGTDFDLILRNTDGPQPLPVPPRIESDPLILPPELPDQPGPTPIPHEPIPLEPPISDPQPSEPVVVVHDEIINAPMAARMLINAGPGTGKTYTVIHRLKKILTESDDKAILVLCFSRNAVQVVRNRLVECIGTEFERFLDEGRLMIRTFDSFASYMLDDELETGMDYDQRIEAFIRSLQKNPRILDAVFSYLVVDEVQDIVGVRARMLLAILNDLRCGALLLGDSCQALYDWTVRDSDDFLIFSALQQELLRQKFVQVELSNNMRQCKKLAERSDMLRRSMLTGSEEEQEATVENFKEWAKKQWKPCKIKEIRENLAPLDNLILSKTNGEAQCISQRLFDLDVQHCLRQSSRHRKLAGWIAMALFGNDGHILTREQYEKNVRRYSVSDIDEKWAALKSLDGHSRAPALHIPEVLIALRQSDSLPEVFLVPVQTNLTVSTVHRAKGSEADHVFWLDSPLIYEKQRGEDGAKSDALKAAYVAASRAKSSIQILEAEKNVYMKRIGEDRWIQTGITKSKKIFCKGISHLPEDTDIASFAANNDEVTAKDTQELIACLEPGLPVNLYLAGDKRSYDIYSSEDYYLGRTSKALSAAMLIGFSETNKSKHFPAELESYVSAVVTVLNDGCEGIAPEYQTSGCWLGFELGGFPAFIWS